MGEGLKGETFSAERGDLFIGSKTQIPKVSPSRRGDLRYLSFRTNVCKAGPLCYSLWFYNLLFTKE